MLTSVTTTLSDAGKVTKISTTYDTAGGQSVYYDVLDAPNTIQRIYPITFGLPVSSSVTDYGSGSPGSVMRTTATVYKWQSDSNFLANHLLSQVSMSQIFDGGGNLCAETDFSYDETTPTSSGVTKQHVTVTGTRGNITTTTRQLSSTPCQAGAAWTPVSTTTAVYDTGMTYQAKDPGLHTTTYSYSSSYYGGYLTGTTLPSTTNSGGTFSHTTSAGYDINTGLVTSYTDQNGKVTSYTYDNMERMVSAVMPDTDASGNHGEADFYYPDAVTIERKQRLHDSVWTDEYVELDGLGRTSRTMIANGQSGNSWNQNDVCYDGLGRVQFKSYEYQGTGFSVAKACSGAGDAFTYDALSRNLNVQHSDGSIAKNVYRGAATDSISEGNGTTTLERVTQVDALGHLVSVCEVSGTALGGTSGAPSACGQDIAKTGFLTSYAFDGLGNMRTATQAGLAARTFTYDSLNRLISATNPESGTTAYGWNTDSELITRVRPIANVPGSSSTTTTTYAYDPLHRVLSKIYSDSTPSANFVYDGGTWLGQAVTSGKGHVVYSYTGSSATSPRVADLAYSFDPMGRTLKTRQCLPGSCPGTTYEQDYTYDLIGEGTSATDGLGHTMTWTYSSGAVITEVQASFSSQPLMSNIQYGAFGMTNVMLGNNQTEVDGYDTRGRLNSINYKNSSGGSVYSVSLNHAADSSITSSTDSANGAWSYVYDGFNRLTSATASSGTFSGMTLGWSYDRYGNRLTQHASGTNSTPVTQTTFSFASNQISGFCYDAAGNLLDETTCPASGSTHQYKYDAEGRLIATAGYIYEYSAGEVRKSKDNASGTPTTLYLNDGSGNQIAELNASLVVQHVNVYSGKHLVGTLTPSTGQIYYAYSDWLGTKRYEADGSGTYINSWSGLPFGDSLTPLNATGVDATEHHFTGREHDAESGLDYFAARYYESKTGRWMLPDWSDVPVAVPYATFTNPQSLNLYTYVGNNPVTAIDADGHAANNNMTNVPVGSTQWQHMTNCNSGLSEPDCLSDQVIPGIMDDAVPPGGSEQYQTYVAMVADSQQVARDQAQQQSGPPPPPAPAPVFQNPNEAAMNAAAGITGAMQATGNEWGAALYKTSDGMTGVTPLRTDHDPTAVGTSGFYTGKDIPQGATRIGDIHGHPDSSRMSGDTGDRGVAFQMLKAHGTETQYMVNMKGEVWKFNPATDRVPVLLPGRIQ
jgi:RHS repeat-associated protein